MTTLISRLFGNTPKTINTSHPASKAVGYSQALIRAMETSKKSPMDTIVLVQVEGNQAANQTAERTFLNGDTAQVTVEDYIQVGFRIYPIMHSSELNNKNIVNVLQNGRIIR